MNQPDIVIGTTYLFMVTRSWKKKELEGKPFKVVSSRLVWRYVHGHSWTKQRRFYNAEGYGARADELEPLPNTTPCTTKT